MSNVFQTELEQALASLHNVLEEQRLTETNQKEAAKLGLYYAHGETDKAEDKLSKDQQKSRTTATELQEATDSTELCGNIVTAATAAAEDARNTNSAASTTAVNVQSSANQLTDLAGDVAAMFAISSSKDFGSKIQKLLGRAYLLSQETSEMAEKTTLQSLNTTIEAAQSRASVSLSQAKTMEKDIKVLLDSLNTNFNDLQTKITADSAALTEAIEKESEQDGVYKTAREEKDAIQFTEEYINKHVNHDLKRGRNSQIVDAMSEDEQAAYAKEQIGGEKFWVSFNGFGEDALMYDNATGDYVEQAILKEYRVIFTTQDDSHSFDIHNANAVEPMNYFPISVSSNNGKVNPTPDMAFPEPDVKYFEQHFCTAEYVPHKLAGEDKDADSDGRVFLTTDQGTSKTYVAKDFTGKPLQRGNPYVIFILAVYDCDYQKEMHDTDGLLTMPSLDFTLLTQLPQADMPTLNFYRLNTDASWDCTVANAASVYFEVENYMFQNINLTEIMDFMVFLIKYDDKLADKVNLYLEEQLDVLSQKDEDYRLSEQRYIAAKQAYDLALATGIGDLNVLGNALAIAELEYIVAREEYEAQEERVEGLNKAKLSNFFLDNDILSSIPEGYAMVANQRIGDREDHLNKEKDRLKAFEGEIAKELKKTTADLDKAKTEFKAVDTELKTIVKSLDDMDANVASTLQKIEGIDIALPEIVADFAIDHDLQKALNAVAALDLKSDDKDAVNKAFTSASKMYDDWILKQSQASLNSEDWKKKFAAIEKLDNGISKIVTAFKKDLKLQVALDSISKLNLSKANNTKVVKTFTDAENAAESSSLRSRLNAEEQKYEELSKSIDKLTETKADLQKRQEKDDNLLKAIEAELKIIGNTHDDNIKQMEDDLVKLKADLAKMQGDDSNDADIDKLNKDIAEMEKDLKVLKDNLGNGPGTSESEDGKLLFVAADEKGTFTDNYGHPLSDCDKYVALVYSKIKDSMPEAEPLFQTVASAFSLPKLYNLDSADCSDCNC